MNPELKKLIEPLQNWLFNHVLKDEKRTRVMEQAKTIIPGEYASI